MSSGNPMYDSAMRESRQVGMDERYENSWRYPGLNLEAAEQQRQIAAFLESERILNAEAAAAEELITES